MAILLSNRLSSESQLNETLQSTFNKTNALPSSNVEISGKKIFFRIKDTQEAIFSAAFNRDGTVIHSARPTGTFSVRGLKVLVKDAEPVELNFRKKIVSVGDVFTANAPSINETLVFQILKIEGLEAVSAPISGKTRSPSSPLTTDKQKPYDPKETESDPNTSKPFRINRIETNWSSFIYNSPEEKVFWDKLPDWSQKDRPIKSKRRNQWGESINDDSTAGYTGFVKIRQASVRVILELHNGFVKRWKSWRRNGTRLREANLKEGTQLEIITGWYENGQKELEEVLRSGKLSIVNVWKPNGDKCPETNIKNGSGVRIQYSVDGMKIRKSTYKSGVRIWPKLKQTDLK